MQTSYKKNDKNREVVVYICGWYLFSLGISLYNKWMFGKGLDFQFPILITAFHQLCLMVLSGVVLYLKPKLRPSTLGPSIPGSTQTFAQSMFQIKPWTYMRQIFPCSLASSGDIGLSNFSFKFVSLSLYTMIKTSSLMFVLIFGLIFRLERLNWRLVIIVIVMTFSVLMMIQSLDRAGEEQTIESTENSAFGILLVLGASMMSGLRWSCTQLLLKHNEITNNSISTIFYISPSMCLTLFVFGLCIEGWTNFLASPIWMEKGFLGTILLMIIPGFLAFMMTLSEFKLLSVAQVTTLAIAGIFKELLTILFGSLLFGDRLSLLNCLGVAITFIDVLWYNYYRYVESLENSDTHQIRVSNGEEVDEALGRKHADLEMKLL